MPAKTVSASEEESSFTSDPAEDSVSHISDATSVADLARFVIVSIRDRDVTVYFDLSEMTPRLRKRLSSLEEGDGAEDAVVEYLSTIITAWTLTDKHNQPVGLQDMDAVSYRDLGKIAESINKSLSPNA